MLRIDAMELNAVSRAVVAKYGERDILGPRRIKSPKSLDGKYKKIDYVSISARMVCGVLNRSQQTTRDVTSGASTGATIGDRRSRRYLRDLLFQCELVIESNFDVSSDSDGVFHWTVGSVDKSGGRLHVQKLISSVFAAAHVT
jgi:hypothetical protein